LTFVCPFTFVPLTFTFALSFAFFLYLCFVCPFALCPCSFFLFGPFGPLLESLIFLGLLRRLFVFTNRRLRKLFIFKLLLSFLFLEL
jgi:hypothetical protein